MQRRSFFQLPLAAGAARGAKRKVIDEYDPGNIKLSHRISARVSDDDLLFLKQIGMRWARVEFGEKPVTFDFMRATQERFARFGLQIYSGVQYAYRETDVQLGRSGRDRHIEIYQRFLRDFGTRQKCPGYAHQK